MKKLLFFGFSLFNSFNVTHLTFFCSEMQVPFRLTRMLVKAMEVSGIEGNFRSTCENVMQVLRTHKDSVMAMMEVNTFSFFSIVNFVIENSSLLKHITNKNFLI